MGAKAAHHGHAPHPRREVDDDWHWSKRLTFWFWAIVLTFLGLVKFFFAPVFFHPRLKVNRVRVQCFPESGPFAQGMGSMIQSKNWKGARQVWLVGVAKKEPREALGMEGLPFRKNRC